jgi:hypothetical protein
MTEEEFDVGTEVREMVNAFMSLSTLTDVPFEVVAYYVRREVVTHHASWRTVVQVLHRDIVAGLKPFQKQAELREQIAIAVSDALIRQLNYILGSSDKDQDGGKRMPAWLVAVMEKHVVKSWEEYSVAERENNYDMADRILRLVAE